MEKLINRILMPVILDADILPVITQVAELARNHHAELHLIYIGNPAIYQPKLSWLQPKVTPLAITREKMELLWTLKEIVCSDFGITVHTSVEWGKWRSTLLSHAESIQADLIVLNESTTPKRKFRLLKSHLEYVIENSPCQVITLFQNSSIAERWKQVVIPITDFVPELRLQTIIETAISKKMKIHLVTINGGEFDKHTSDFYFLTETLKRLKPAGNVQVECRCIANNFGPIDSFLNYARSIKADMLMTKMGLTEKSSSRLKEMNFFLDY
ncbi:MAG: universal stress protein [Bacteroidota bacterium]